MKTYNLYYYLMISIMVCSSAQVTPMCKETITAKDETITIPTKGSYNQLTQEEVTDRLAKHKTLLSQGITSECAEAWYAVAEEYRHLFEHEKAWSFAEGIYEILIAKEDISSDIKSKSYRALSKLHLRAGSLGKACQFGTQALALNRESLEYGKTLCYLGDLYCQSLGGFYGNSSGHAMQGQSFYREVLSWSSSIKERQKIRAQALLALGNTRYSDKEHPEQTSWHMEALDIAQELKDKDLEAEVWIHLASINAINHYSERQFTVFECCQKALNILKKEYTRKRRQSYIASRDPDKTWRRNRKPAIL